MNHQFLHRGVVGGLHPELLGYEADERSVEARYLFTHTGGKRNRIAGLPAAEGIVGGTAAYVLEDAEQRTCHAFGLLMIEKPGIPGLLQVAWPFIRRFTERVFAEDRMAVEAEQRAWDEQGEDRNHEVFPLILDVREVLRANGVPLRARPPPAAVRHRATVRGSPTTSGVRTDLTPMPSGPAPGRAGPRRPCRRAGRR
jgi:hypothetical protein